MKFFEIAKHEKDGITGIRIGFLFIMSFTITHSNSNGSHINIGLGIKPLEFAMQFSIWDVNYGS